MITAILCNTKCSTKYQNVVRNCSGTKPQTFVAVHTTQLAIVGLVRLVNYSFIDMQQLTCQWILNFVYCRILRCQTTLQAVFLSLQKNNPHLKPQPCLFLPSLFTYNLRMMRMSTTPAAGLLSMCERYWPLPQTITIDKLFTASAALGQSPGDLFPGYNHSC